MAKQTASPRETTFRESLGCAGLTATNEQGAAYCGREGAR